MKRLSGVSITEPLENTNALSLAPQDIALLFRDSLGWTARMEKSEPVVVVGPRGCGKTMLFRYLAIASQGRPLKSEATPEAVAERLKTMAHLGFLLSCGQLRTPFLRSAYRKLEGADAGLAEEFCREFLSANFALQGLRAVAWLYSEKLAPMKRDDLRPLCATVASLLGPTQDHAGREPVLEGLIEVLERRCLVLSNMPEPGEYRPTQLSRDDVLARLAQAVHGIPWASSKQICFLLDDYSVTVLPTFVLRAYNPVLFRLSSELRIKISSEGEGPILEDILGRKYKEGRELTKVNLGEVYFRVNERRGREFFEQILEARFQEVGKGSLNELRSLLGEHPNEKGFGSYICSQSRPGDTQFYGFGLLCSLCSGDVSFIIELLHNIAGGRWGDGQAQIPPKEQDAITKEFSQRQLAALRRTAQYGTNLYEFAQRLGNLLKQYLLDSRGEDRVDERLRIEIEGGGELCPAAQTMHEELLRHSVLIDGGSGKSRQGLPTRKLYFRRLFAPCFPFSPSRRGCIALTVQAYEDWLSHPDKICAQPEEELPLFPGAI
jgi:hypothetical protein